MVPSNGGLSALPRTSTPLRRPADVQLATAPPTTFHMTGSLSDFELLARQNGKGRPACGSSHRGHYNTSAHVAALILILVLSTLACSFPIVARRFPRLPIPHRFLFLSRHFGTGVLIATAFVHLLPTAFVSMTDPCLPPFWNKSYPAMPGLVAMLSVMAVVGIEMFFATRGAKHVHRADYGVLEEEDVELLNQPAANGVVAPIVFEEPWRDAVSAGSGRPKAQQQYAHLDASGNDGDDAGSDTYSDGARPSSDLNVDEFDDVAKTLQNARRKASRPTNHQRRVEGSHEEQAVDPATEDEQHQQDKMLLQCLLLEAGILFHSVFIGMAVSVATGTAFVVLLIAISFHQTFEGLALGSRIAAVTAFGPGSVKPWLMALAYGTTTPIGQAIGLLMHRMYDPASEAGLLMVGFMNAISSGLLLFAGLVQLLAEDFLADASYKTLQGRKRLEACAAVVVGSLLMALVGAWA